MEMKVCMFNLNWRLLIWPTWQYPLPECSLHMTSKTAEQNRDITDVISLSNSNGLIPISHNIEKSQYIWKDKYSLSKGKNVNENVEQAWFPLTLLEMIEPKVRLVCSKLDASTSFSDFREAKVSVYDDSQFSKKRTFQCLFFRKFGFPIDFILHQNSDKNCTRSLIKN